MKPRPTSRPNRHASSLPTGRAHLASLRQQIDALDADIERIDAWGRSIAGALSDGHRILVAGNGGSAAQAQHLTSELVGRYRDERQPFSAIALHSETSSVTAIVNDYGPDELFARQVRAHGRAGDILLVLSTSGRSPNVIRAVEVGRECGLVTLALTGRTPNPLASMAGDAISVESAYTATVQEIHQIVVHLLCAAVDVTVGASMSLLHTEARA